MAAVTPPEFVYCYILPSFIGCWLFVSFVLSFVGGWHALAKKYRSRERRNGKLYSFSSMLLGSALFPMSYRGCMFIRLDSTGISLTVFPAFRFFHPPLFIPWDQIVSFRQERFWFMKWTTISLADSEMEIRFLGKVGKEVMVLLEAIKGRH